jgi:PAS domain S-box
MRSEQMINSMPVALMILDDEGKVSSVNPVLESITSYHWKDMVGKRFPEQKFMTEEATEASRLMWEEKVSKGETAIGYDMPIIDANKNKHILSMSEVGLKDAEGKITWMYIGEDVTEARRREGDLRGAIEIFGSALSKASSGDLLVRVGLDVISEEYRSIGEDINSMIEATKEREEELREKEAQIIENSEYLQREAEKIKEAMKKASEGYISVRLKKEQEDAMGEIADNINLLLENLGRITDGIRTRCS